MCQICFQIVNTAKFTVKQLFDKVLRGRLNFNEPSIDVVSHEYDIPYHSMRYRNDLTHS
jgi:hypothetical protein